MPPKSRKKKETPPPIPELVRKVSDAVSNMSNHTQEAMKEAWEELEEERRKEVIAIPLIAFALISLLALISYSPADLAIQSEFAEGARQIHNWIGKPGAWLAHGFISIFGATGFALPALLLLWGVDRFISPERPSRKIRIAGCAIMLCSLSTLLGILSDFTIPIDAAMRMERIWQTSGAIGFTASRRLLELGPMGALIVNFSVIAAALVLCTPFLFTNFFYRLVDFFSPIRDEEELEADAYEDQDDIKLRPLNEEPKGSALLPLYEWDEEQETYEDLNIRYPDEEEQVGLPPLMESEPGDFETQSDFETIVEWNEDAEAEPPSDELRIVTSKEETLEEVDLSVNLIHTPSNIDYEMPPINLLVKSENTRPDVAREEIIYNSQVLEQTLKDFNIPVKVVEVNYGPTITCYELEPAPGIKISRIENLANDITRSLKAANVRIVAPIPGKGTVGVEVPNRNRSDVFVRDIIACEAYQKKESKLKIGMGKTISGEPYVFDLVKAPHLLVAGATGSGKSVCINTIITSLLYNAAPHEVKLLLVDPKQVELALYRDIPHLLSPVITDPRKAGAALRWAVEEMETRYRYLKKAGVRNITEYNKKRMAQQEGTVPETDSSTVLPGFLPYVVIIIDELADLMMIVRVEVEGAIARLAAMARAVGIHLVLATQRPSVDVLTGVIKNNFPSRIAFQVSATADSRTILDMKGAESLLGRGDMLLSSGGANKPIRMQCAYVSTEEVEDVCDFVKEQQEVEYVQEEFIPLDDGASSGNGMGGGSDEDELYDDALQVVLENDAASTSLLQRRLKIGYGRAARLLDLMEDNGIVGPPRGSKPREVILNKA